MPLPDLTETERRLWDAFPAGRWVDLRVGDPAIDDPRRAANWGTERTVRAEVLRALLLGAHQPDPGSAPGIRLRGARVIGRLDLLGATTYWPLVCEYCVFDREIRLVESVTKTVRIVHSKLPGLNATRMRLDGILNLWASMVDGMLRLDQAKVTGQVTLRDATVGASKIFADAVPAFGISIDGGLELTGLTAHGLVSINVAKITGSVDLNRSRLANPGSRAFSADSAEIGGRLDGHELIADGEVTLQNARIAASVSFDGALLNNPGGMALNAGGVVIGGGVHLTGGIETVGEVRLIGAQLAANLTLAGATMSNRGGVAVNLDRAFIGVCHGAGLTCIGRFNFAGAHIASGLDLADATIDGGTGKRSLAGDGAVVDGTLVLNKLRARGELSLRSIRVGRALLMIGADLENQGDIACRLSGAEIAGDVIALRMSVAGGIRMTGGKIAGRLNLDQVRIANAGNPAISARALQAGQLLFAPAEPITGTVDFSHARIEVYRDDPKTWPDALSIDGMTYQALEPRLPARDRLRWLATDPSGPQSQPYEQLAAHYVRIGQPEEARTVWYVKEREQRREAAALAKVWGVIQDVMLGYGYRPWRALTWLALLLIIGSVTFGLWPPTAVQPGPPPFNPVIYTLDLLLPLVDLGQKHSFSPSGAEQWLSYLLIAAGWVLVTTVAAAAARVLRRG